MDENKPNYLTERVYTNCYYYVDETTMPSEELNQQIGVNYSNTQESRKKGIAFAGEDETEKVLCDLHHQIMSLCDINKDMFCRIGQLEAEVDKLNGKKEDK